MSALQVKTYLIKRHILGARAFSNRRCSLIMNLTQISTWSSWSLQSFEISSNVYAVQVIWAKLMRRATALAVFIRRLSWSIPIHFDPIHFRNLRRSHKLQKNTKIPILKVQGYLRSSIFTPIRSLSLLLVMISLSLIHIWRCRRIERCRSRWSPYH